MSSGHLTHPPDPNQGTLWTIFVLFLIHLIIWDIIIHFIKRGSIQQLLVLLFSGSLQVYGGTLLFHANTEGAMKHIPGLLAMVPTLMDLKGNVEISRAARLSTIANTTQHMHDNKKMLTIMYENIILVQAQVTIVSTLMVLISHGYGLIYKPDDTNGTSLLILYSVALFTSSIACTILGTLVSIIITMLNRAGYDPDDVATSIAGSVGDLTTIFMMTIEARFINPDSRPTLPFRASKASIVAAWITIVVVLAILPLCLYFVYRKKQYWSKFINSMPTLIGATLFSLVGGCIWESTNDTYAQITLISPFFSSFVGNSVSIIANLLTTHFEKYEKLPRKQRPHVRRWVSLKEVFWQYDANPKVSTSARSHLLHVLIPCQFLYLVGLRTFMGNHYIRLNLVFCFLYILEAFILLGFMIYLTANAVHACVRMHWDPEETVIPITTSAADFFGSVFLVVLYKMLNALGDENSMISAEY